MGEVNRSLTLFLKTFSFTIKDKLKKNVLLPISYLFHSRIVWWWRMFELRVGCRGRPQGAFVYYVTLFVVHSYISLPLCRDTSCLSTPYVINYSIVDWNIIYIERCSIIWQSMKYLCIRSYKNNIISKFRSNFCCICMKESSFLNLNQNVDELSPSVLLLHVAYIKQIFKKYCLVIQLAPRHVALGTTGCQL